MCIRDSNNSGIGREWRARERRRQHGLHRYVRASFLHSQCTLVVPAVTQFFSHFSERRQVRVPLARTSVPPWPYFTMRARVRVPINRHLKVTGFKRRRCDVNEVSLAVTRVYIPFCWIVRAVVYAMWLAALYCSCLLYTSRCV